MENTSNNLMFKVFTRMFLGLLATAIIAIYTFYSGMLLKIPYLAICIAEIVVVLLFSFLFKKLPAIVVTILYFVYAILTGVTFSTLFLQFNISTMGIAFLATALLFGALALFGYVTKKDISKFGTLFTVTLIIGVIVSIINLIIGNTIIDIILDWVILFVFCGLTAIDMNKIKNIALYSNDVKEPEKIYVYGAMELYLDFINMFLRILSIISRFSRRD